jgi:hypothetical protein
VEEQGVGNGSIYISRRHDDLDKVLAHVMIAALQ